MFRKSLYNLFIPLMLALVLGLPVADVALSDSQGIGQTEKISNELGAQGKGNAYGLRDKTYDTGSLDSATSAAPLPPVLAALVLVFGVGLKTFRNKRGN